MALIPFFALVRKDLLLFFSDRRAVIVAFAVPIAIGSFIGAITGGSGRDDEPRRVSVALVDQDGSAVSKAVVLDAQGDKNLAVIVTTVDDAKDRVRKGTTNLAVVIPQGFGERAGRSMFRGDDKPELGVFYDPSRSVEVAMVRGILTEHVMQAVSKEMFSGDTGRRFVNESLARLDSSGLPVERQQLLRELMISVQKFYRDPAPNQTAGGGIFTMPYTVREEAMTSRANVPYNGYAHSFAGMGIQFLLFSALNLGIEMLVERERGLWARLRSAPISRSVFIAGKMVSITIVSLMTLLVSFAFAIAVFHVRIDGSYVGFMAVAIACSMMAAGFGLLVATVGNTPKTARGVSTLVTLVMVMLGGAWIPTFVFPKWLQQITVIVPVRWAVDGLDATTWRGLGLSSAVGPTLALLAFTAVFTVISLARFRWQEG
jgi:linearmycin/streptolysin S transport system permease protein